jgi:hypothetical protein
MHSTCTVSRFFWLASSSSPVLETCRFRFSNIASEKGIFFLLHSRIFFMCHSCKAFYTLLPVSQLHSDFQLVLLRRSQCSSLNGSPCSFVFLQYYVGGYEKGMLQSILSTYHEHLLISSPTLTRRSNGRISGLRFQK